MFEMKMTGDKSLAKAMSDIGVGLQKKAAVEAGVRAVLPLVETIKGNAPRGSTGALKDSIGFRMRQYGRNLSFFIGPRRGIFQGKKPSTTAGLIERGHFTREGPNKKQIAANPFMAKSWAMGKAHVLNRFRKSFSSQMVAIAQKKSAKGKK